MASNYDRRSSSSASRPRGARDPYGYGDPYGAPAAQAPAGFEAPAGGYGRGGYDVPAYAPAPQGGTPERRGSRGRTKGPRKGG